MPDFWQQAKEKISVGALAPALDLLAKQVQENLQNEVILYQANHAALEKEERLFGADKSLQKNNLTSRILQFIDTHKTEESSIKRDLTSVQKDRLIKRQLSAYQLLEEWEEKMEVAENPNEKKRSEMEINRLKKIIAKYNEELNML